MKTNMGSNETSVAYVRFATHWQAFADSDAIREEFSPFDDSIIPVVISANQSLLWEVLARVGRQTPYMTTIEGIFKSKNWFAINCEIIMQKSRQLAPIRDAKSGGESRFTVDSDEENIIIANEIAFKYRPKK